VSAPAASWCGQPVGVRPKSGNNRHAIKATLLTLNGLSATNKHISFNDTPDSFQGSSLEGYNAVVWSLGAGMQRRDLIKVLSIAAVSWPLSARAQQPQKSYRVGLLSSGAAISAIDERRKAIIDGLAVRGFVEGKDFVFEQRYAEAHNDRLNGLAADLKAANMDVIITFGYPAALAAKMSAKDIPIVVTGAGDPVATGLVEGLSRPGGNLTGVSEVSTELSAKRLEILKDALPGLQRVAMLWNAADLGMSMRYRAAEQAASVLGVKLQTLGVREPNDFEDAFAAMISDRPDAILMVNDALTNLNRKRVVEFAKSQRLPTIFENGAPVREGGLMSYGPSQSEIGERAAEFVVRILRGARPADLPLELPTRFEFFINLKAAKALGLTIPPTLIARADEVIE
jgi:putative ABC transport system substrate-binding protein